MTVRSMSALPPRFFAEIGLVVGQQSNKNGPNRVALFPPKAKVGRSNRLGRANKINTLRLELV